MREAFDHSAYEQREVLLDGDQESINPRGIPGDVDSLRPIDDRGGPTSFYQGPIDGIIEIAVRYDNEINGRHPLASTIGKSILFPPSS